MDSAGVHGFSTLFVFSVIAFTLLLLRYNSRQRPSLYDQREGNKRADEPKWDGIEVSEDGLIYPGASKYPTHYKGAMLMPNTFTMLEIIRSEIDYYFDLEESGKDVEIPFVYSIRKGTPLPSNLLLFREGLSTFSLQPSQPMSIKDFNTSLDSFYETCAEKKTAEQWLDDNDFWSAVGDDAEDVWMAR